MIFRFGRPPGQTEFSAPVRAAFWITLAGVLFTATITSVRQVTPDLHVFEAVMFRSLFGIVFMVPWLIRRGISQMRTRKIGLLAIRGSLAFFVTISGPPR
jgi:drug/metabolite transporter (DMT)-like permease